MKVVCFVGSAAGGLICTLLNKAPLVMNGPKVEDGMSNYLKSMDSPAQFDIVEWNRLKSHLSDKERNSWIGTHYHPSMIHWDDDVEKIVYVGLYSVESLCALIARNSLMFGDSFDTKIALQGIMKNLRLGWSKWQQPFEHPKVITFDFYEFITKIYVRKDFFESLNIAYYESDFQTWAIANRLPKLDKLAQAYNELRLSTIG